MKRTTKIVEILSDSIPFIRKFSGSKIVIKYGGSAQINPNLKEQFAKDIVLLDMLGVRPIIVHGGGKRINSVLDEHNIESKFVDGHRVTCQDSMKIVEMVLSGEINKELTMFLNRNGAKAVGISGKDAKLFDALPKDGGKLGFTGEITSVDATLIQELLSKGFVPIISPIAGGGELGYNINADSVACEIAKAIKASKVIFLTDTKGVLDKNQNLLHTIETQKVPSLISDGTISGGMIPKILACVDCIENGVEKVHIIDGRVEHGLLLELFTTDGVGSEII